MSEANVALSGLPELGVPFTREPQRCADAAQDFGHLVEGRVLAVVRPCTADQVAAVLRYANAHGLTVTPRAGGNGQSGQSIAKDGLTLDLTGLDHVDPVDTERAVVRVGAGLTWRTVLAATLQHGLVPRVMPLNLDLTVGGTLSAGGIGSTSHREGAAVWHVPELEVVTGKGEALVVSPEVQPTVYGAVLGGTARVAVITAARLALRPSPARVRTYFLAYDDVGTLLDDQHALARHGTVAHMEGFCAATLMGLRKGPGGRRAPLALWSYGLHVSVEHDQGVAPPESVLEGLRFSELLHTEDDSVVDFAARYDVRFEAMRKTGADQQLHPWFECLVPRERAKHLVPEVLAMLPMFFGDGHRLTVVADRSAGVATAFPEVSDAVALAVLPMGIPAGLREPALAALRAVHDLLLSAGGRRYVSGWMFDWDESAQRAHFGTRYQTLSDVKRRHDPNGVLTSLLFSRP